MRNSCFSSPIVYIPSPYSITAASLIHYQSMSPTSMESGSSEEVCMSSGSMKRKLDESEPSVSEVRQCLLQCSMDKLKTKLTSSRGRQRAGSLRRSLLIVNLVQQIQTPTCYDVVDDHVDVTVDVGHEDDDDDDVHEELQFPMNENVDSRSETESEGSFLLENTHDCQQVPQLMACSVESLRPRHIAKRRARRFCSTADHESDSTDEMLVEYESCQKSDAFQNCSVDATYADLTSVPMQASAAKLAVDDSEVYDEAIQMTDWEMSLFDLENIKQSSSQPLVSFSELATSYDALSSFMDMSDANLEILMDALIGDMK